MIANAPLRAVFRWQASSWGGVYGFGPSNQACAHMAVLQRSSWQLMQDYLLSIVLCISQRLVRHWICLCSFQEKF